MPNIGTSFIEIGQTWSEIKVVLDRKNLSLQYVENSDFYELFALDSSIVYTTKIYKNVVPTAVVANGYSQSQNDADRIDFENVYKNYANYPLEVLRLGDPRLIHRFGNLAYTAVTESLVYGRIYVEPPSQAQRSVVSTSTSDSNPSGSGAKKVRIEFLNSNYVLKREDISLSGTTPVNTVNTDIRFIQDFYVIAGTSAVGAIRLMSGTAGAGSEICGIGSGADSAFLCHHYVPSGSQARLLSWGATVSDDAQMRLRSQRWTSGSLVDPITLDLDMMTGIVSGSRLDFERKFNSINLPEKTYTRVTAQPGQSTSTTVRARMDLWQDVLYISGTT